MFKACVEEMLEQNIYQWDDIYPDMETLSGDIERGEMQLVYNGLHLVSAYVINEQCDEAYKEGNWQYPSSRYVVLHRLCVNPNFQNRGIAKKVMRHIEEQAKERGFETVRLDCFTLNPYSNKLYTHQGYATVGTVTWRKGDFYLMEKEC